MLGIYVHIPFCREKCLYCDFCSFPHRNKQERDDYIAALCRQAAAWGARAVGQTVDTVYFGGGTPSLLDRAEWERLFRALRDAFAILPEAEITVEVNPATVSGDDLAFLHDLGVNRLSIGVQSANENELRALGRIHTFDQAVGTVRAARQAGFARISLDVMLGIPHQTRESLDRTLCALLALSPEHISAYLLKVESGTPFGRMADAGRLVLPDEDEQCDMYLDTVEKLTAAGLAPYEISNFARPGEESRHNMRYWLGQPYLGLGLAAHSDFGGHRFAATTVMDDYLAGHIVVSDRVVDEKERKNEYIMLRLRLYAGLFKADFCRRFGEDFDRAYHDRLLPYIRAGLVRDEADRVAFTPAGMLLSNTILAELTDFS